MKSRWLELALLVVLALAATGWVIFPPFGRPSDLELTVSVAPATVDEHGQQEAQVTVRWHWRRHPLLRVGSWLDGLGFVYDADRWFLWQDEIIVLSGWERVVDQAGEARPIRVLQVDPDRDGAVTYAMKSQVSGYTARSLPLRVEYIRFHEEGDAAPGELGWVQAVGGVYSLEAP